jgi:hypothetical protein
MAGTELHFLNVKVSPDGEFMKIEFLINYSFIKGLLQPIRKILNETFGTESK